MRFEHRFSVPAADDRVWATFVDLPTLASCLPGVEALVVIDARRCRGRFGVAVGPIRLTLDGEAVLEVVDPVARTARLRADGTDRRLAGGVRAIVDLAVVPSAGGGTEVVVHSDVQVLGRIGELGQPIMRRKADEVMRAFVVRLTERLS